MEKRRKDPRYAVELSATLFWDMGEAMARTRNVSERGAALHVDSASLPPRRGQCELSFRLPDIKGSVDRPARLRWSISSGTRTLAGVEFVERLPADVMAALVAQAEPSDASDSPDDNPG